MKNFLLNNNHINKIAGIVGKTFSGIGGIIKTPFMSTAGKPFGSKVMIHGSRIAAIGGTGYGAYKLYRNAIDRDSTNTYGYHLRNNIISGNINQFELGKDDAETVKQIGMKKRASFGANLLINSAFIGWDSKSRIKENKKKYALQPPGYRARQDTVREDYTKPEEPKEE